MKKLIRVLLPVLVVGAALFVTVRMIQNRKPPAKAPTPELEVQVEVTEAHARTERPVIRIAGTVLPARQIELRAQVGGEVLEVSPQMQPGGFLVAGETLVRLDERDYRFALERRKAELAKAEFDLQNERGMAAVAEREWALLGKDIDTTEEGKALTLRKPHLQRAEAALAAARSSVDEAELNVARTVLKAPFNAMVRSESVDPGQIITPQTPVAMLTGTDTYWVRASIPVDQLAAIDLPDREEHQGAAARIIMASGTTEMRWEGRIIRLLSDLDQAGRMARLLIAVDDPLNLKSGARTLPLLLDAYVQVEIDGKPLENVVALPSHTLHEGDKLYVVDAEERLQIRDVHPVWREQHRILVASGLSEGDRVVTSRIGTPLPGLKLHIISAEKTAAPEEAGRE